MLLGPPNPDASSRKELRWGKRGSFALTLDSGRWRDYESGRSGGVLALVERETGADRAGALEWLKSPRIPGNRPERPASEAHTTTFSGPDAQQPPTIPPAARKCLAPPHGGGCWRLVGCREAHSRRRRPRGAPMDESSQPLANGTSATLRPPMVARASSGLARAAHVRTTSGAMAGQSVLSG